MPTTQVMATASVDADVDVEVLKRETHTIRRKGERDNEHNNNPFLRYSKQWTILSQHRRSMPMTALDLQSEFDLDTYSSLQQPSYRYYPRSSSAWFHETQQTVCIDLSHHNIWHSVVALLEEHCTHKSTKRSEIRDRRFPDRLMVQYRLPVVAERIFSIDTYHTNKRHQQRRRYMLFNGHRYPVKQLYQRWNKHHFESIGKLEYETDLHRLTGGSLKVVRATRHRGKCKNKRLSVHMIDPTNSRYNRPVYTDSRDEARRHGADEYDKVQYAEVDLGANHTITHLSIMGERLPVRTFPDYYERRELHLEDQPTIQYVDRRHYLNKHWVTKFEVHVRADSGRKWIGCGTFSGNRDRLTEVVHRLENSMNVRYIRFIPHGYVGTTAMQVGVFGAENPKTTTAQQQRKKAADVPTVEYSVEFPSQRDYWTWCWRNYDYRYGMTASNRRRCKYARKEEMSAHAKQYNDGGGCGHEDYYYDDDYFEDDDGYHDDYYDNEQQEQEEEKEDVVIVEHDDHDWEVV